MAEGQVLDGLRVGTKFTRNGVKINDIVKYLSATADMPNVAAGDVGTIPLTVTGIALGDVIIGIIPTIPAIAGLTFTASVSAADTVQLNHHNGTVGASNLATDTYTLYVLKP